MFADDTKLVKDISDIEDNKILQKDMQELNNWSDKWLLRLHPDKCKVPSAGKQKTQQYLSIRYATQSYNTPTRKMTLAS